VPYEDLYETLLQYYQTPVNVNTATREEFRSLLLLNENQISNLLRHREQNGHRGGRGDHYSRGRTMDEDYFKDDPFKGF